MHAVSVSIIRKRLILVQSFFILQIEQYSIFTRYVKNFLLGSVTNYV